MSKRALYREYRPSYFSDVIGQDHVTLILKNQIREQSFSHAYLFCGSRGTGKTSSAKILSRAINCLDPKDGEPCGKCEACRIAAEGSADIIEIDAASNNGVDNVRELIDQAQFAPLQLKYRVFIIDEVHMLSTAAFNALLKTLEEPPKHVIFILATTEPQKLPATIISRCQRFDFHRLTSAHIISRLKTVLDQIGAVMEPDGMRLIARAADGSMRDALSLADQCLSFCGSKVSKKDVEDTLGNIDQDILFSVTEAVFSGKAADAVLYLDKVISSGRDVSIFLNDLIAHLRNLMLVKVCGDIGDILDLQDDQLRKYKKCAALVSEQQILYVIEKMMDAQSRIRFLTAPRVLIESALIRASYPAAEHDLEALEARVAKLETSGVKASYEDLPFVPDLPKQENATKAADLSVPEIRQEEKAVKAEETKKEEPVSVKEVPKQEEKKETVSDQDESSASGIWKTTLSKIRMKNPMVYYLAKDSVATALNNTVLNVVFPPNADTKKNMCTAAVNMKVIQECLNEVKPGLSVTFLSEQLDEKESRLKDLFGEKLTIEE